MAHGYGSMDVVHRLGETATDYTVNRKFREADYEITIHPNGSQKGVKQITLDGQPIQGTVIPYSAGKHIVEVTM